MVEEVSTRETILGSGAGGPLSAPGQWIQYPGYIGYAGGVIVGNGQINQGNGTLNAAAIYINGALINLSLYFPYSGGTFTGMVTLAADPTSLLHAATKRYVDTSITTLTNTTNSTFVPLAGGTMTGVLTLSSDPTLALHAATKEYVDTKASGFTMPDAPSDGNYYGRLNGTWASVNIDAGTF